MNIYIVVPKGRVTGGPELAHQFCNAVNTLTDEHAYICYREIGRPELFPMDEEAPEPYRIYNTEHVVDRDEMDREENIIVVPEGLTYTIDYIHNAKIVLWWMSVDNYLITSLEENIDTIRKRASLHLFQSYYAENYIKLRFPGAPLMYMSDYINSLHGKFVFPPDLRQDLAFYNPVKSGKEMMELINKTSWLKWVPLKGLAREKMVLLFQSGKVYVDFGNHPGKDRIPREAAADGCVVITNKNGAAAYDKDVPISEKYKFENPLENLDEIDALLHDIVDNFAIHQNAFSGYREFIKNEKAQFDEDVKKVVEAFKKL